MGGLQLLESHLRGRERRVGLGDEHVFYETVKLHELQRYKARMAEDVFDIAFKPLGIKIAALFRLLFHGLNYLLMALFGLTNGWGESVSRPCLVFAAIYFGFAQVYDRATFSTAIHHAGAAQSLARLAEVWPEARLTKHD